MDEAEKQRKGREILSRLLDVVSAGAGMAAPWIPVVFNAARLAWAALKVSPTATEGCAPPALKAPPAATDECAPPAPNEPPVLAEFPDAPLELRTYAPVSFQEAKRQHNTEGIIRRTIEELKDEQEVPTERPDADWISRFFRIAEDVTTERMQLLWGRVLAGELKRPGTFSLRTLEVLRNMTQAEAELFRRFARFAFRDGRQSFLPVTEGRVHFDDGTTVSPSQLRLLGELGLTEQNKAAPYPMGEAGAPSEVRASCGTTLLTIRIPSLSSPNSANVLLLTNVGREVCQLIDLAPAPLAHLRRFARSAQAVGGEVWTALITEWLSDGGFMNGPLTKLPPEN